MCIYYVSRLSGCIYMLIISARIADRSKGFILAQRECTVHCTVLKGMVVFMVEGAVACYMALVMLPCADQGAERLGSTLLLPGWPIS